MQLKQTNKNIGELFVIQYYGHLKELFNFNKLPKLIHVINLRLILFYNERCNEYLNIILSIK